MKGDSPKCFNPYYKNSRKLISVISCKSFFYFFIEKRVRKFHSKTFSTTISKHKIIIIQNVCADNANIIKQFSLGRMYLGVLFINLPTFEF